jgi:hypothetical protein
MKVVRWLFIVAFYLAADFSSPVPLTPPEAFAGEMSASIHGPTLRRVAPRLPARHGAPAMEPGATRRRVTVGRFRARTDAPEGAVRKVPDAASDAPPGPEGE